jgi:hypothetical protein
MPVSSLFITKSFLCKAGDCHIFLCGFLLALFEALNETDLIFHFHLDEVAAMTVDCCTYSKMTQDKQFTQTVCRNS